MYDVSPLKYVLYVDANVLPQKISIRFLNTGVKIIESKEIGSNFHGFASTLVESSVLFSLR